MIDTQTPDTPGWWLKRLLDDLSLRAPHYAMLDSYYDGTNVIPIHAHKQVRESFQRLMGMARTNFAEMIVEAVRERMQPVGFRTGKSGDKVGDKEAWRIWQANSLDADSKLAQGTSLAQGLSFVIVGPVNDDIEAPLITPELPTEVTVEVDPRHRRKVIAGLKVFRDDVAGEDVAYLYLPGKVHRARRRRTTTEVESQVSLDIGGWEWVDVQDDPLSPAVVPFPNRPKIGQLAVRGEFETHLPLLDRINYTVLQELEVATLQAFRQRALKGGPRKDPVTGDPIDYNELLESGPGTFWHLPEGAELWESGQVDLGPMRLAIRDFVQDLAAVTRTPLYYLTPDAANGSAAGASLSREGLVFKTLDRMEESGEAWEQVMSLAFRRAGDDERAKRASMEVLWRSPERMSLAERADAGTKAIKGGLTLRAVRERVWDASPQEIEEMERHDVAAAVQAQGVALAVEVLSGSGAERQPDAG